MIDDFSNPSREVAAQARDLEKRFNNVADVFAHAGEAFTAAGETLIKSVTAPLVAVGTAAIKFSSDSQDAFQQFAAATGTATEEMGKYKDMINNVYKDNFGESINDVAEAMATTLALATPSSSSIGPKEPAVPWPPTIGMEPVARPSLGSRPNADARPAPRQFCNITITTARSRKTMV